ncbi:MAG: TetR/AcrR family transcriptional regulator [Treponema sp.]|jgi:AcrR family transcriptional regulator|nr:TetR/AcrR family transcriptional regulator [Treponema sp.]
MSIVVEHDKRRREILEKALDVFIDEGFEDVTFQKLADRCGITRTTLYIYFKNKKDIFNFSIKQLLQEVEEDITGVRKEKLSHTNKLVRVMTVIIERLEENRRLLLVVLNYLFYIAKSDYDPDYRVRRRTVRLRHILSTMLIEGIKAGEFADINVKDAVEFLYGILESAVFRLTVLRRTGADELRQAVVLAVQRLAAES